MSPFYCVALAQGQARHEQTRRCPIKRLIIAAALLSPVAAVQAEEFISPTVHTAAICAAYAFESGDMETGEKWREIAGQELEDRGYNATDLHFSLGMSMGFAKGLLTAQTKSEAERTQMAQRAYNKVCKEKESWE